MIKDLTSIIKSIKIDCKQCTGYKEECPKYWVKTAYTTLCEYRIIELSKKEYRC